MRIRMMSSAFLRPTMDRDPTDSASIGDSASTGSFFENNPQDRVSFDQTEQMILQNMMKEKKAKKKSSKVARVRSSSGVEGKQMENTGAKFSDSMATTLTEMMSPYGDSPSVASLTNTVVSARSTGSALTLVQPIKRRLSIEEKNAFKMTESTGDFSKSGQDSFSSLDGLTFSSNPNAVRPSPAGIMKKSYSLNRMRSVSQRSLSSVGENANGRARKLNSPETKIGLANHLGQTVVQFDLQKDDSSVTENSIDPMFIFKDTNEKSSVRDKKMKKSKSKKSSRSVSSVETTDTPVQRDAAGPACQSPLVREKKMKKSKSKKSTRSVSSVETTDTPVQQDAGPLCQSPLAREKKMKKSKSKKSTRSVSSVDTNNTPVVPDTEAIRQSPSTNEKKKKKKKDKKRESAKHESADDVLARWNSKIEQLEQERAAADATHSSNRSPVPRLCADSERDTRIELSISEHSVGRPSVSRHLSISCMSTASSSLSGDETSRHKAVRRPSLTAVFDWGREPSSSNLNADWKGGAPNNEMNLIMTKSTVPDRRKCLRKSHSTTDINHYNRTTTWPSRRSTRNLHAQFYHRSTNLPTSDTVDRSTESSPVVTARQILDVMEPVTPREVRGFNGVIRDPQDNKLKRKTSINYGEILGN